MACSSAGESDASGESNMTAAISENRLELTDDQRRELVSKKATCPFVGTALALKKIAVYGSLLAPFVGIADGPGNVLAVGNTGGGDIGEGFRVVARANHHLSPTGEEAPNGMFSLDFPASRGAHAAHSFILMGNPRSQTSGRLSAENLERLINLKSEGGHAERAPNGSLVVRRSELGRFVARNVACDPNAVTSATTPFTRATLLGVDLADFERRVFNVLALKLDSGDKSVEVSSALEDLVQIAVGNQLIASVSEFSLLMMFLGPSTETVTMPDGEPALSVSDITAMFAGEKRDGTYDPLTRHFPANWETTPKTIVDLVRHLVHVLHAAAGSQLSGEFRDNTNHVHDYPTCPRTD
jgi:hypothetical protein